jgi:ketosteroid isomerase-like protein
MARAWLARKLLIRNLEALNRGDVGPILRMETDEVHFHFPGSSSWAADTVGKAQVEAWLKRMVATGLQHRADEVVVSGPPWRMSLVLRGTDHFEEPDGTPVYDNRYVIWARTRWGRIYDNEVYEDTERSLAFDNYLAPRLA